jgi:hypothetical protein
LLAQSLKHDNLVHDDMKHGGIGVRFAQQVHPFLPDFNVTNNGPSRKTQVCRILQINPSDVGPVREPV